LTSHTGRFTAARRAVPSVQGICASLSGLAASVIVDRLGYSAALLSTGVAASVALVTLFLVMPETANQDDHRRSPA